mmetsp:Transcript_7455/g.13339  ORF Transcript_7455/g.13339 Transcript_7455/m.13339 type:complete len:353 (+) Transcript_7455:97-1155(+)
MAASGAEVWDELIAEASTAELEAMRLEQDGELLLAARTYERVVGKLLQAADGAPQDHAIRKLLESRAKELLQHSQALVDPGDGDLSSGTSMPSNRDTFKLVAEGLLATTLATTAEAKSNTLLRQQLENMSMAAVLGGTLGMAMLGPAAAVSVGAGMAYATSRDDAVGNAARSASSASVRVAKIAADHGLKAVDTAFDKSRQHIKDRLAAASPQTTPWLHKHQSECKRLLTAIDSMQESLPRRKRTQEAKTMRERFPDRIPVLCLAAPGSGIASLERPKFLVPGSMMILEFKFIVHRQVAQTQQLERGAERTIYLFVGGTSPQTSRTLGELYDRHCGEDGFLHILYSAENTLG